MSTLEGPAKLAYMANQIALHFAAQPGGAAAEATRDHLRSFWTPAMRRAIVAHAAAGGAELSPTAAKAVAMLKEATDAGLRKPGSSRRRDRGAASGLARGADATRPAGARRRDADRARS